MNTDLWMALGNPANRRGQPLLLALLHVFCPAAARWWLAGADPLVPFDPLWQAHHLRATGRTLREVLEEWEFGPLMPAARKYVERVRAFREQPQHRHIRAPELLPTFLGGRLPVAERHGLDRASGRIGGWQNFFPFIRAWAFTLQDWQQELGIDGSATLDRSPGSSGGCFGEPLVLSTWRLQGGRRTVQGLFAAAESRQSSVPRILFHCLSAEDGAGFHIFSEDGTVSRSGVDFGFEVFRELVVQACEIARQGPGLPVNAFCDPACCNRCGYRHLCWADGENGLTPLALGGKRS
jgi:hypothetical protein